MREKIGLYTDRKSIGNNTKKSLFFECVRGISRQSGFYYRRGWTNNSFVSE